MISYADIQHCYNNLYVEARKYLWDFEAVNALADLEIACYKTCQDIEEVTHALDKFLSYAYDVQIEDEDFAKAVTAFHTLLDDADSTYVKLYKVNEVIDNENI